MKTEPDFLQKILSAGLPKTAPLWLMDVSLTYRFAQVSFFSMCVACELEVVPYAVMKGLIARHLDFWMKYPIFDTSGLLTIGYGYSNLLMSEQYNASRALLNWAMKAFAFLSLPKDHPFWQEEPAPLPALPSLSSQKYGGLLIQRIHGDVTAYCGGRTLPHHHVHTEEKIFQNSLIQADLLSAFPGL